MNEIKVVISLKTLMVILGLILLCIGIFLIKDILLFLFAAYILSSALFPLVDFLGKRMPKAWAITLIFIAILVIVITILVPFLYLLVDQIHELINHLPKIINKIQALLATYKSSYISNFLPSNHEILSKVLNYSESLVLKSLDFTMMLFGMIVGFFTLAAIVLFILIDKDEIKQGILSFFPKNKREQISKIAENITTRLGGYVRGQLMIMFLVGLITGVIMHLMGIPFALLLGIIAGILEIVPIIGPILSAVPAVILAFMINPWLALGVIIAYLVIQRVENLITPFVYGKFLDMPPIVIISAILIASVTLGVFGVILSPAIAAALYVVIQELYLKKINS
ncbi:MAG: AI-2E family transporter [Candidatus Gastranaerophilales bacterium]|nr:AI-2E family transporter [Candidatus Gastranaerophilales bacterium]